MTQCYSESNKTSQSITDTKSKGIYSVSLTGVIKSHCKGADTGKEIITTICPNLSIHSI
jgi:hypothetical protein